MRRGFTASLLKRPNVDAARLLDCAPIEILLIIMKLPLRGKLINPRPIIPRALN
jgi:hypothetical protein